MQENIELALQHLLYSTASQEEIILLRQALSLNKIAIGGNVNDSILINGSNNLVINLPAGAIDLLGARALLGNLERDLTSDQISLGLTRLTELIPDRAPCLRNNLDSLKRKLNPFLQTVADVLSEYSRQERTEALAALNGLCVETLDVSFYALCLIPNSPVYDNRCPFRGLEAFRLEDKKFFFGREELKNKLITKIREHNFLAVVGASGSGKSSLVMAGVIPALNLSYEVFRPGTEPLLALKKALQSEPALMVVDQFEELFNSSAREQQQEFISSLLDQSKKRLVIVTLRSDFLDGLAPYAAFQQEVENYQISISPMTEIELRLAIESQAKQVSLRFEADLSQQMLDNVAGEPGAMPLLQHALWLLWGHRHGWWLRADEYRAFGGVKQAITSSAENIYLNCSEPERKYLRNIFLWLTHLDESAEKRDTRQRVPLHELISINPDLAATNLLINKLTDARLLVVSGNEIEVAHEAVISSWERLRKWLNQDRESQILLQVAREDARRWDKGGRKASLLKHSGHELKLVIGICKSAKYPISATLQDYLDACLKAEKDRILLKTGVSVMLVVLLGLLVGIFLSKERAVPGLWVTIPAGNFVMGMDESEANLSAALCLEGALDEDKSKCQKSADLLDWSGRQADAKLPAYEILDNEVTRAQYQQCVLSGGCQPPQDWLYKDANLNQPATNLNWFQAGAYCGWLGGRLPTEGEWEKAARGPNNFSFPWGNTWEASMANLEHTGTGGIQSIEKFAKTDISGYGIKNMAGNAIEWTASEAFPSGLNQTFSNPVLVRDDPSVDWPVVLRGGSWKNQRSAGMAANRETDSLLSRREGVLGFRCACPTGQTCKTPWSWQWVWFGK